MSQKKASVRKANPAGLLRTGETGGLIRLHPPPPLPPLIKQRSTIAHTGATARTATSSGRQWNGTGEEAPGEEAKLKLNMVRMTRGVCLRGHECTVRITGYLDGSIFEQWSPAFSQMAIV